MQHQRVIQLTRGKSEYWKPVKCGESYSNEFLQGHLHQGLRTEYQCDIVFEIVVLDFQYFIELNATLSPKFFWQDKG